MNETRKIVFPANFIKSVLIDELGSMLPTENSVGYPYQLFILISIGIEFLGACEDQYDWDDRRKNKDRFLAGLNLFDPKYYPFSEFLYKKLRCGMAHIFAPIYGLHLGENRHNTINLLGYKTGEEITELHLNIHDFYRDFKNACQKAIDKIANNEYGSESKVYQRFLSVPID
jgi:hypothetical protein